MTEHGLVFVLALARGLNMAFYWKLNQWVALTTITVIAGVPQICTSYLFSFIIFAWAAIYHNVRIAAAPRLLFK